MTGFKSFTTAAVTIAGIELAHGIRKRQFMLSRTYRRLGKWSLKREWAPWPWSDVTISSSGIRARTSSADAPEPAKIATPARAWCNAVRSRMKPAGATKKGLLHRIARSPRVAFIGLIFFNALSLHASAATAPQGTYPIHLPVTITKSNPVTTISVGGRTVQAIVDTGGDVDGAITLSKEVIDRVGAVSLDTVLTNDGFGNQFKRPRFRVLVARIGGHSFRNMVVIQAPDRAVGGGPAVPNAIGRQFLSQYFVVVDYAGAIITLWPPDTKNPADVDCGRIRIPMQPTEEDRLAVSEFETELGRVRLTWDTGAMYSMLSETTAERLHLPTVLRGTNSPKFFQSKMLSAAGQDVGPLEFVVLPLAVPKDFEGMLGENFFEHHIVCLDYRRREIRVH